MLRRASQLSKDQDASGNKARDALQISSEDMVALQVTALEDSQRVSSKQVPQSGVTSGGAPVEPSQSPPCDHRWWNITYTRHLSPIILHKKPGTNWLSHNALGWRPLLSRM